MVSLKDTIQKAVEAFAEEIVRVTAESIKADFIAKLGASPAVQATAVSDTVVRKRAGRPKGSKNVKADAPFAATTCLEPGCTEKRLAKGLCRKHYYKDRREKNAKSKQEVAPHPIENGVTQVSPGPVTAPAPF